MKKLLAHYGWKDLDEARAKGNGLFTNSNGEDIHTFEVGFKNLMAAAGTKEQLASVIETLMEAVTVGELDKALAAAKKERLVMLRKG
ncbi:hypothetical protein [Magnetospirillum sp. ME-1]|uniref:hypothetical protein n=1 Tax=Magnetospirillum sp. ME-1 TaxID=1639348 RepID=UPI001F1C9EC6|nr:hypothetical protein [Magnetospirillum sp. ME-1]